MTYVHCAACRRAFDAAAHRRCPGCGTRLGAGAGPASVEDEVADAAAQLARALARATPGELDGLAARLGDRPAAAPAGDVPGPDRWAQVVLGALGGAVAEERALPLACVPPPGELQPPPAPDLRALATALVVGVAARVTTSLRRAARPAAAARAARAAARTAGLARRVWSALA